MGLWSKLFGRRSADADAGNAADATADPSPVEDAATNTVELPTEPFVFECQSCGKVFEARRKHPQCPECDSDHVVLMSE